MGLPPAAPPVGALADRGAGPVTSPARMAAPVLDALTTDGLDVTLAAAPSANSAPITAYDLRYALGGGVSVEVQTRAVNAEGAGAWGDGAVAVTVSAGLPDGIVTDPEFLDGTAWDVVSATSARG
ncbi:hypothetical protein [Jannaschia seohaensis]|nr:hypothetical protein [Jannaschia seohaensis]